MHHQTASDRLFQANQLLRGFLRMLPFEKVTPQERYRLGGYIFYRHLELTDEVAQALRRSPESFPEARGEAELIEADSRKGQLWQGLGGALRRATDAVVEQAALCQGRSVERSRRVLQGVLTGASRPELCPHLPHRRRVELMESALRIQQESYAARVKKPKVGAPAQNRRPRSKDTKRTLLAGILEKLVG